MPRKNYENLDKIWKNCSLLKTGMYGCFETCLISYNERQCQRLTFNNESLSFIPWYLSGTKIACFSKVDVIIFGTVIFQNLKSKVPNGDNFILFLERVHGLKYSKHWKQVVTYIVELFINSPVHLCIIVYILKRLHTFWIRSTTYMHFSCHSSCVTAESAVLFSICWQFSCGYKVRKASQLAA